MAAKLRTMVALVMDSAFQEHRPETTKGSEQLRGISHK